MVVERDDDGGDDDDDDHDDDDHDDDDDDDDGGGDDGGIDGWGKMRMMAMMIAMRMMATVMVNGEDGDQEQETHSLITLCLIITEYPVSHQCL